MMLHSQPVSAFPLLCWIYLRWETFVSAQVLELKAIRSQLVTVHLLGGSRYRLIYHRLLRCTSNSVTSRPSGAFRDWFVLRSIWFCWRDSITRRLLAMILDVTKQHVEPDTTVLHNMCTWAGTAWMAPSMHLHVKIINT